MYDDSSTIFKILNGEINCFSKIVDQYQAKIFNLFYRATNSRALSEDLTQESFIKAFKHIKSFNNQKRFYPWLYQIALNILRDHFRTNKMTEYSLDIYDLEIKDSTLAPEKKTDYNKVLQTINTLDPLYKEPLILRFKEEFSIKEISETLEINMSATKMRIKRGLNILQKKLGE